jgi:hypothetical protein
VTELPEDDPGWGSVGGVLTAMLFRGPAVGRGAAGQSALVLVRQVYLSFCVALCLFLVVLVLIGTEELADRPFSPEAAAGTVIVVGFALVLLSWRMTRELPCDETRLVEAYRARFFLRAAMANAPALFGFVSVFLTGSLLPYLAGLVPAAVGFARNAPSRAHLQQEDEKLRARGCAHSLYALVRTTQPDQRR